MDGPLLAATHGGGTDWPLLLALALAGALGAGLLGVAVAAFLRRRSGPYLLVVAAIGALVGQPLVGALFAAGTLDGDTHHLLEHGLDVTLAALVIGAVWHARRLDPGPGNRGEDR